MIAVPSFKNPSGCVLYHSDLPQWYNAIAVASKFAG
jgi:hypothetical protein